MKHSIITLFLSIALLPSCMSVRGPNGEKVTLVMTNVGFTTDQSANLNSDVGMGDGFFSDDVAKYAHHSPANGPSGIKVGPQGIEISGIIDQSTPIDEAGEHVYKSLRAYFVLEGFRNLFDNYFGNQALDTEAARDVDLAEIGAETDQAEIAAKVDKAEIGAAVQKAEIEAGNEALAIDAAETQ